MSTTSNTGHANNVANLSKLNLLIGSLGSAYNPANEKISGAALNALKTTADAKISTVSSRLAEWKSTTNNREILFEEFNQLISKLFGSLQSFGVKKQMLDDFKSVAKQIRGKSKPKKKAETIPVQPGQSATAEEKSASTSQRSFDDKIQHFNKLLLLLDTEPLYKPNEPGFTTQNLRTKLTALIAANDAANVSYTNLKTARMERNTFFYAEETGLLDLVRNAKAYIKSICGTKSQEYKAATGIRFTRSMQVQKAA